MSKPVRPATKLVPVPSRNMIPERDIDKTPILECQHLGIDFGGLTAVDEFTTGHRPHGDCRTHRPQRRRQDHGI